MKTTTTANISGLSFCIDEDAYARLASYLKDIEAHLHASDSKAEIMQDIEARIAELLQQHLKFSHMEVVNITMVEDIVAQLGKPEEISDGFAEDSSTEETPTGEEKNASATARSCPKRLYRDIDNQLVGGVCAGLSKRFGVDAVWFRLAFILLLFVNGIGMFYLLLWLIIPAANTTARRLEMNGREPSAENIRMEVENQGTNMGVRRNGERSTGSKLLLGCLCILALPVVGLFLVVIISLIMAIVSVLVGLGASALPFAEIFGISDAAISHGLLLMISFLFAVMFPIIGVVVWAIHSNKSDKPLHKGFWITALVLWLLSLMGIIVGGIHTTHEMNAIDWNDTSERIEALGDSIEQSIDRQFDSIARLEADTIIGEIEVGEMQSE